MIKAQKNGLLSAVMLAFLATAGLFYVNLGGAFLSAFVDGLGISRENAGYITSANKYGAAMGALLATFLVHRVRWRQAIFMALTGLIVIDLLSFMVADPTALIAVRFLHGTIGGFSVGLGLAVIARTAQPDKGYGMLLVVQYSFGSLGIFLVPKLVGTFGHGAAFGALICFSLLTIAMLPFIPDYEKSSDNQSHGGAKTIQFLPLLLAMGAVFLFQASNMGVADYALELGKENGRSNADLSDTLALANIISVLGAILVYVIGTKFGRVKPIMLGLVLAASFTFLFHWSENPNAYFFANMVTGICWAFVIPYLLGLGATFDGSGQMAALAGFVSKMGLASGPLVGALLVGEANFAAIINAATIGLIIALFLVFWPANMADKRLMNLRGE